MGKIGFVYIWRDRKHKRYYIGAHWGTEDDGYICSSSWMKNSYKRRPNDFKRRILKTNILTRKEMFKEEQRWLDQIKENEFGKRYYNLQRHWQHWSGKDSCKTVGQKISASHRSYEERNGKPWGWWSVGKVVGEETKQKLREANAIQFQDDEQREMRRQKSLELWEDPEYRAIQVAKKKGIPTRPCSEETKKKIRLSNTGKRRSEETKQKIKDKRRLQSPESYIKGWETRRRNSEQKI